MLMVLLHRLSVIILPGGMLTSLFATRLRRVVLHLYRFIIIIVYIYKDDVVGSLLLFKAMNSLFKENLLMINNAREVFIRVMKKDRLIIQFRRQCGCVDRPSS